jgi:hypothetical protein
VHGEVREWSRTAGVIVALRGRQRWVVGGAFALLVLALVGGRFVVGSGEGGDKDGYCRAAADLEATGDWGSPEGLEALGTLANDAPDDVREASGLLLRLVRVSLRHLRRSTRTIRPQWLRSIGSRGWTRGRRLGLFERSVSTWRASVDSG